MKPLSRKDVADRLGISTRTVSRMVADGRLPAPDFRLPGRCGGLRWQSATFEEWVKTLR
mgnify:CR=1 FL=1